MTTFTEDNLLAGLKTFTKPGTRRHNLAIAQFNKARTDDNSLREAIEIALETGVTKPTTLTDSENKLETAREAALLTQVDDAWTPPPFAPADVAPVTTTEPPVPRAPRTVTIQMPSFHRTDRETKSSKVRASKDGAPTKGKIIRSVIIGFVVGLVIGGFAFVLLMIATPHLEQWIRDLFLIPILVLCGVIFALGAYRKVTKPLPVHQDEHTVTSTSSNSSELGFGEQAAQGGH